MVENTEDNDYDDDDDDDDDEKLRFSWMFTLDDFKSVLHILHNNNNMP